MVVAPRHAMRIGLHRQISPHRRRLTHPAAVRRIIGRRRLTLPPQQQTLRRLRRVLMILLALAPIHVLAMRRVAKIVAFRPMRAPVPNPVSANRHRHRLQSLRVGDAIQFPRQHACHILFQRNMGGEPQVSRASGNVQMVQHQGLRTLYLQRYLPLINPRMRSLNAQAIHARLGDGRAGK